jgi:hypothetical protein
VQQDGSKIWAVGKAGGIQYVFHGLKQRYREVSLTQGCEFDSSCIDSLRGTVVEDRLEAHRFALFAASSAWVRATHIT